MCAPRVYWKPVTFRIKIINSFWRRVLMRCAVWQYILNISMRWWRRRRWWRRSQWCVQSLHRQVFHEFRTQRTRKAHISSMSTAEHWQHNSKTFHTLTHAHTHFKILWFATREPRGKASPLVTSNFQLSSGQFGVRVEMPSPITTKSMRTCADRWMTWPSLKLGLNIEIRYSISIADRTGDVVSKSLQPTFSF